MKKLLSVFLAIIMVVSVLTVGFSVAAYDDLWTGMTDIPNIYIQGWGEPIYNADGTVVYDAGDSSRLGGAAPPDFDLMATINECLPYLRNAFLKDEWDAYNEKLLGIVDSIYGGVILDKNGDPRNGSDINKYWLNDQYQNRLCSNGKYALRAYNFHIDWRIDPFVNAERLNSFIQNSKASTGKDKVNITARCEASNIVAAFLEKYGTEDVNCCSLYVNTAYGCDAISDLFSGDFYFDGESIQRFKEQGEYTIGGEDVNGLIDTLLDLLIDTYALDSTTLAASPLIHKLYEESVTKVILHSYGTMPGIWSVISAEDYAKAKRYIFAGVEDEYAGLIAKLDYYDEHVRQRTDDLFKKAVADGAKIQFIGKYGDYAMVPITINTLETSDGSVNLSHAAPGATVAKRGKVLSKDHIAKAEASGKGAYISDDRVVDTSTCLFPETTWVIHNSRHEDFPDSIHEIIADFFASDGTMTVSNQDKFPQFLHSDDEGTSLVPLTAENGSQPNDDQSHTKTTIREKFIAFIRMIINLFKKVLKGEIQLNGLG